MNAFSESKEGENNHKNLSARVGAVSLYYTAVVNEQHAAYNNQLERGTRLGSVL